MASVVSVITVLGGRASIHQLMACVMAGIITQYIFNYRNSRTGMMKSRQKLVYIKANLELMLLVYNLTLSCRRDECIISVSPIF